MKPHLLFVPIICMGISVLAEAKRREAQPVTGLDISLESLPSGYYGRTFHAHGRVYQVRGIAELEPIKANIRARLGGVWVTVTSDKGGNFSLQVPVPTRDLLNEEEPDLELEISNGSFSRTWEFPVDLQSPLRTMSRTDRRHYEPGDTVHFWIRVSDVVTGRPMAGIPVTIEVKRRRPHVAITGKSGVAIFDFVASSNGRTDSEHTIVATLKNGKRVSAHYYVGKREVTDLLIDVSAEPKIASPGELVTLSVSVKTVRGTPARGARVSVNVLSQEQKGVADDNGTVQFQVKAPIVSDLGSKTEKWVDVKGTVHQTGARKADFSGGFRVRQEAQLEVSLPLPHGGLIPETDDTLIVSVSLSDGTIPKSGTRVRVQGSGLKNGVAVATLDRHGLVSLPLHLRSGEYAVHQGGDCAGETAATFSIAVDAQGTKKVVTRCVPVLENVTVSPLISMPMVFPGKPVDVRILRGPSAEALPVKVSLNCRGGAGATTSEVVAPRSKSVRLVAPEAFLGLCTVTARPMLDMHDGPTLGLGASETLLVRPERPSFPLLSLDHNVYPVKGKARLTIKAPDDVPNSWVAVLVRDLAQHQGEKPFEEYFLDRDLEQAVFEGTASSKQLIRTALAQYVTLDRDEYADETGPSGPNMETDAARRRIDLIRQASKWMVAVERLLIASLKDGTLDDIVTTVRGRRRFVADIVDTAVVGEDDVPLTLGDGAVTIPMLTALDSSFTFDNAARRVARRRLVHLLALLAADLNPEENDESRPLGRTRIPPERRLSDMVRRGVLSPQDLLDPWGHPFVLKNTGRTPRFVFAADGAKVELLSPGPDGRIGTSDDIRDPWMRAIPEGTLYAQASGEDRLMAQLSAVSLGTGAFERLLAAYDRLNDEAVEELIGDALGLFGHGGGSGIGSGYGRGAGGLGGRRGRAPRMRSGAARVWGKALAGMLREEFPATLYFNPDAPLSSGQVVLDIPLAHAATTYLVETVLWRADGWRWSSATAFHVNQDLLIDAPVPTTAAVGDEIQLPVRLSNRTAEDVTVGVSLEGSRWLGIAPTTLEPIRVPAEDTVEVPVSIHLQREGEGAITLAATDASGHLLDAVRRPIVIAESRRRASAEAGDVFPKKGTLQMWVPAGATPMGDGTVTVAVGASVFYKFDAPIWGWWLNGFTSRTALPKSSTPKITLQDIEEESMADLALFIGAYWANPQIDSKLMAGAITILTDHLETADFKDVDDVETLCQLLMRLSPAGKANPTRVSEQRAVGALLSKLRGMVSDRAALFANAPWLHAKAAAALFWSGKTFQKRAEAFLSWAREGLVPIGDDLWLEGGASDVQGDRRFGAGALLALAELHEGKRSAAYRLLRSAARLRHLDAQDDAVFRYVREEDYVYAAAAAAMLSGGEGATSVDVTVDGETLSLPLENGEARWTRYDLGQGGKHTITVHTESEGIVLLKSDADYAAPWNARPPHVGPFFIRIDGTCPHANERADFRFHIHNRLPRMISEPVVEMTLPAGVEVDETCRKEMARFVAGEPIVNGNTLVLHLEPMKPGERRDIPLRWLMTLAGQFSGLGIQARAAERPEAVTIAAPRKVRVQRGDVNTGGTP